MSQLVNTPNGPFEIEGQYSFEELFEMPEAEVAGLVQDFGVRSFRQVLNLLVASQAVQPNDVRLVASNQFIPLRNQPPDFEEFNTVLSPSDRAQIYLMVQGMAPPPEPSKPPSRTPGRSGQTSKPKQSIRSERKGYPIPVRYPVESALPKSEIDRKRQRIHLESGIDPMFSVLTPSDLEILYQLYNVEFFNENLPRTVTFEVSARMTKTAGMCISRGNCEYTLRIANLFPGLLQRGTVIQTAGWSCSDRLRCLQLVFEHELIHLLMVSTPDLPSMPKSIYGSHGKLFQDLAFAYFHQSGTRHNLFDERSEETPVLTSADFSVGDYILNRGEVGRILFKNPKTADVKMANGQRYRIRYPALQPAPTPAQEIPMTTKADFQVGQRVRIRAPNREVLLGTLSSKNPKTAYVRLDNGQLVKANYDILEPR